MCCRGGGRGEGGGGGGKGGGRGGRGFLVLASHRQPRSIGGGETSPARPWGSFMGSHRGTACPPGVGSVGGIKSGEQRESE